VIQVLPRSDAGRAQLDAEFARKNNADVLTLFGFTAKEHPDDAVAQYDFGTALFNAGQAEPAQRQFERALALDPGFASAHANLGIVHYQRGDLAASERGAASARSSSRRTTATRGATSRCSTTRRSGRATRGRELEAVMARDPDLVVARLLAWILATAPDDAVRSGKEAVRLATMIASAEGAKAGAATLDLLAAACAEAGRFKDALQKSKEALDLATAAGDAKLAARIEARRAGYRERKAWRDDGAE
jgi:Flp pilus assembly protein TadD